MKNLIISKWTVVVSVFICCGGFGGAEESALIDPFSADAPVFIPPPGPDHLLPIPAYHPFGYDLAVFQSLVGYQSAELWMIGRPSFGPEYAVILRCIQKFADSENIFNRKVESEKWVVEYVEAKKQIWRFKDREEGGMELDIKVTKELNRNSIEVSNGFADAMHSAWESVLKRTRYPDADYKGLDGITYQFYCRDELFGEIWSPHTGTPRMIADLGHKLGEAAKADKKVQAKLLKECLKLAEGLLARTSKLDQRGGADQPATVPESKLDGDSKLQLEPEGD